MAGMISAFVELPGASNHEDFKFPWSLDEINHLVSDRKANRQEKKKSQAVQSQFSESDSREHYGKRTAPGPSLAPDPQSKYYPQASRPSATTPNPGGPTQEPNISLKKSLKYVTGLVKQKIVCLEEKAALLSYNESPNVVAPIKTLPTSPSDPMQRKKTSERRTEEDINFAEEDMLESKANYSYQKSQKLEMRSELYENHKAYPSAQGSSTFPPGYYQTWAEIPAQEGDGTPRIKQAQRSVEMNKGKRKDDTRKKQPKQDKGEKSSSNMAGGLRKKVEDPVKMEERPSTGSSKKVQAPESKSKTTSLGANDLQIHDDENLLSTLKRFKTIFLVDDSASMATNGHWEEAVRVLVELAKEASQHDTDGLDLQFLNSESHFKNIKASSLLRKFKTIQPTGDSTPTETKVEEILRPYIETLEIQKARHQPLSKPLNLVIITDGIPDDIDSFISIISHVSSKLDDGHFPLNQIGIQFLQIGAEKRVSRVLKILDNHLQKRYGISRDMIDTTQFTGVIDEAFIVKCLLGGINRRVDRIQYTST
ncbi:hypothetical protein PTTG_06070 [Puccinia triticina 1-1 BBBD Race 1]|uniref:VWFA domain-containing protein n=1 Tax=Puccinia triticina (isolate 1-1 / race 1 (BBBD)) TaxID=630390 RepID=A0A180GDZ4_PUCT1|nr:hypothetical protein PTTG_06070 [Puccinia triticina 1-1 BBBD Race 1]